MADGRHADAATGNRGGIGGHEGDGYPQYTPNIARAAISDFDAGDPASIMAWDFTAEEYGSLPPLYDRWRTDWTGHVAGDSLALRTIAMILAPESVARRYCGTDDELVHVVRALRKAVRLPIGDALRCHLQDAIEAYEAEVRRRLTAAHPRKSSRYGPSDWEHADLVAEIAAVAGDGKRQGRSWWFVCPLHADKNPSLHVDPDRRLWHCFGCGAGGGVVAFRRTIEGRAA
jgi:hypothetical protein